MKGLPGPLYLTEKGKGSEQGTVETYAIHLTSGCPGAPAHAGAACAHYTDVETGGTAASWTATSGDMAVVSTSISAGNELTLASVEGESFTAEVLARLKETEPRETIRLLSKELEKRHRLVSAQGIHRLEQQRFSLYRFWHNLFQKYLYGTLDEVERTQLHEDVGRMLETLYGQDLKETMERRSWGNLFILNEWRRLGVSDPVTFHQRFWQTLLVCPGGGTYRWNEDFATMESTVYGHPGEFRVSAEQPGPLADVKAARFGLTFEDDGLRARAEVDR